MRCGAHTFNLVASSDADAALRDGNFKAALRKAMSKAQALWNTQNRSTVSADIIEEELSQRLKTPNETRWNSRQEACLCILDVMDKKGAALQRAMMKLKIALFTDADRNFLKEYCSVRISHCKRRNFLKFVV